MSSRAAPPRRRRLVFTGTDDRLLASSVGLSFDDELPGGALQAVDGGLGEKWVCHDRQPLNRVPVRGEHRGRRVVALDDKLIEIGRLGGIEGLEGEVIKLFRRRNNSTYPDLAVIPMIGVTRPKFHQPRNSEIGIIAPTS